MILHGDEFNNFQITSADFLCHDIKIVLSYGISNGKDFIV